MKTKLTLEWFCAAGIRAIKTVAQTAIGMFTVGMAISEVDWKYVISVSIVSGILSMLTSLAGLPEVGSDGTIQIDTSNPEKDNYLFLFNDELSTLADKKTVKFVVEKTSSQE